MNAIKTGTPPLPNISDVKTPSSVYSLLIVVVLLIIILVWILAGWKNPLSQVFGASGTARTNVLYVVLFVMGLLALTFMLMPGVKELGNLFRQQMKGALYAILYTIGLILVFNGISAETINKYAKLITPLTIAATIFVFYKGLTSNAEDGFNVNYERIKTMVLMFCLFTVFCVLYTYDPGGYITEYFGYSFLLTIVLTAFAIAYLIIVLTLPDTVKQPAVGDKSSNFLQNFGGFGMYNAIAFFLFIIAMAIVISTYPGGFFTDKTTAAGEIILILAICVIWASITVITLFPETHTAVDAASSKYQVNYWKRALLGLFSVVISGLVIGWIAYNVQHLTGKTGIERFVLNMLVITVVIGLIYKTLFVKIPGGAAKQNLVFSLLTNVIFYIPCLFSELFDSTEKGSFLMLILAVALLLVYFKGPSVFNTVNLQGGKQLVNKPVGTDSVYSLGTYQDLNGSDKFDYQYAISCWVFLESAPPNTNSSYNKYTSLLNFGKKPNVLYNGATNTLMVTMHQKNLKDVTKNKLTDFDENGNRILYKGSNFLLQKWNNIIINYSGGILDLFINGELVKSDVGVVPYYTLDSLTIGEDNGVKGGICNVVYFSRAITTTNISYLYDMVKDKTPPVLNDSNETILAQNVNTTIASLAAGS